MTGTLADDFRRISGGVTQHSTPTDRKTLSHGTGLSLPPGSADTAFGSAAVRDGALRQIPGEVANVLAAFSATSVAPALRDRISDFARFAVLAVAPLNRHTAEQTLAAVVRLTDWAHGTRGLPLHYGLVLSDHVIARWQEAMLATKTLSAGTISNYRGHLRRVAHELGVTVDAKFAPITRTARVKPYTQTESETHRLWARTLPTDTARARGTALLALCGGAGLTSAEMVSVRAGDVLVESGTWVKVGGTNPRLTPVAQDWAAELRDLAAGRVTEAPLFPADDGADADLVNGWLWGTPARYRPVPQRLRATWIVSQLHDESHDDALLAWAGIERGETLAGYLPFLGDVDPVRYRRLVGLRSKVHDD